MNASQSDDAKTEVQTFAAMITAPVLNAYSKGKEATRAAISNAFVSASASSAPLSSQTRAARLHSAEQEAAAVSRQMFTQWSRKERALGRHPTLEQYRESLGGTSRRRMDEESKTDSPAEREDGNLSAARKSMQQAVSVSKRDLDAYSTLLLDMDKRKIKTPLEAASSIKQFQQSGGSLTTAMPSLGVLSSSVEDTMAQALNQWATEVETACLSVYKSVRAEMLDTARFRSADLALVTRLLERVAPVQTGSMVASLTSSVMGFTTAIDEWPDSVLIPFSSLHAAVTRDDAQVACRSAYTKLIEVVTAKCDMESAIDNLPSQTYEWIDANVLSSSEYSRIKPREDMALMRNINRLGTAHVHCLESRMGMEAGEAGNYPSITMALERAREAFVLYLLSMASESDPLYRYADAAHKKYQVVAVSAAADRTSSSSASSLDTKHNSSASADVSIDVASDGAFADAGAWSAEAVDQSRRQPEEKKQTEEKRTSMQDEAADEERPDDAEIGVPFPSKLLTEAHRARFVADISKSVMVRVQQTTQIVSMAGEACKGIAQWATAKNNELKSASESTPLIRSASISLRQCVEWVSKVTSIELYPTQSALSLNVRPILDRLQQAGNKDGKDGTTAAPAVLRALAGALYNELDATTKDPVNMQSAARVERTHSLGKGRIAARPMLLVQLVTAFCVGRIATDARLAAS
jgi:hypothetical protein